MAYQYYNDYLQLCENTKELEDAWLDLELDEYRTEVMFVLNDGLGFFRNLIDLTETVQDVEYLSNILISYKRVVANLITLYVGINQNGLNEVLNIANTIYDLMPISYKVVAEKIQQKIKEYRYKFYIDIYVTYNTNLYNIDILYDIKNTTIETFHKMLNKFKNSIISLHENLELNNDIMCFLNYQRLLENNNYNIITQCSNDWLHINEIIVGILREYKLFNGLLNFNNIINFCNNFENSYNEYNGLIFKPNISEDDIDICCKSLQKIRKNFEIPGDIIYKILYNVLFIESDLYQYCQNNYVCTFD